MKKTSSMKFSPRFPTLDDESNKENIHNNNNENEKKPKEFPRFKDSPNILISPKVRSVSDFKEKLSEEKYFFKSNYLLNEEKEKIGKELDNLKKTKGRINEKDDIIQNQEKTGDKTNVTYKKSKDLLNFMNRIDEKNSKKKRDDFNLSNLSKSEKKIARIDNQDYSFENSDENDVKYYNLLEEYKQLEDKFNNLKKNNQTLSFNLKNTKNEEIPKENLSLKEKETGETNNHKNYKELEKKYFNLVEQHSSLEKDYKILNIKENSSLNELYQQKNSILDLFEKNAISQKEIFTLRNQQDSILKQKEDEIKELRKYQSSLLDDLEKNKILIKDLKTNEYVLLELIRNKEEEINDLRINQSSLIKDSLDNSNQDYKVLEKNYQDLCQDFTSLKKESDVLKNAQELLLKLIRNKENKIDEYEKKCIILSKEKVNLQNEIKDLNSVLNASADEKKISDKEIERLNNCLITIREENSNCNKEIETLNNCLNAINHEKNNHIKIKEDFKNLLNPISDENNYSDNNEKKNLKYFLNQNNINETKNVESKSEILNFNKDIHFMKLKLNEQIIFNELSKIKNLYDELNDKHLRLLKEKSEIENNFRNFQESQEEESESNKKQKQVIIGKLLKLTQEKLDIESSFKNFKDFKEKELQSLNLNQYEEIHIKYLKLKEDFMNFRLLKEKEISEKLKTFEEFEKEMFTLNEMKDKLEATVILLNKKILDLQLEKNESTDENNNLILAKKELEDEILAIKLKYNNISTNIQQFNDSIKEKNIKNEGESKIASKHDSIEKNLIDIDYNKELFLKEQNSKKKMKNDEAFDLLLMKFKDYKLSNLTKKSELPYKLDIKNEKISGNDIETVMKMLKIDHQKSKRKLKCFYENLLGELLSSYINFIENLMKSSQITQISKISVDFLQNEEKIKDGLRTKFNDLRNNFGKFKEYIKEIGEKEVEWLHSIYGAKAASFIDLNIFSEFYQNQKNSILLKN